MKKVVVLYKGSDWKRGIPFKHVPTRAAFEDWNTRALKFGVEMYRSSIDWYDLESNTFSKGWTFRDGKWIKITKAITPDLIFDKLRSAHDYSLFDKKMEIQKKVKIYNNPIFRTIADNKLGQYLMLSDFMPKTFLANNGKEYKEILSKQNGRRIVVKPFYGSGGFGVLIDGANKLLDAKIEFPVIIQEFIEAEGIPGFSNNGELADLRLIYQNHNMIYALSRIAKPGSLFTNFHQGATAILVPDDKIPENVLQMAEKIVAKLSIFKEANYSLDFIFDLEGKPYLVEMNTTPGFDLLKIVGDDELIEKNLKAFLSVLE